MLLPIFVALSTAGKMPQRESIEGCLMEGMETREPLEQSDGQEASGQQEDDQEEDVKPEAASCTTVVFEGNFEKSVLPVELFVKGLLVG